MTRYAPLPTLTITDKGSVFVSTVMNETDEVRYITLHHAATKHAQTIRVIETTHGTMKTPLKLSSGELCKKWQKCLLQAVLLFNTTCHTIIECEPRRFFPERVPYNILDYQLGQKTQS